MTPQQATELDSDTLRELAKEAGFDWHKYWQDDESSLLETFANLVLARRAPAPTEPAVDRDAVAAIKTDYAGDANFRSAYLQGFYAAKAAVLRLFATPASPVVPSNPMAERDRTITDLIAQIYAAKSLAWRDSLFEQIIQTWEDAAAPAVPAPAPLAPNCRMQGGICACRSGGSFGGCAIERNYTTPSPEKPAAPQLPQASQPTSTPESVNLLVEEARRVMGQDGGAEGGDGERSAGHRSDWYLMSNCRRLLSRNYARKPNWVIACELFATGSTSAMAICKRAGIDPEATKIDRAAPQPQEQS